jgi:hypothetical protein
VILLHPSEVPTDVCCAMLSHFLVL